MRWTPLFAGLAACTPGKDDEPEGTTPPAPITSPPPAPTAPPAPTVPPPVTTPPTDTNGGGGGGGSTDASVRVLHTAPGLPPQDLVVNGNLPPVLADLAWLEGTNYVERAFATYTFQLLDTGAPLAAAWTTFDYELLTQRSHTIVIYGTADAPAALALLDDDVGLDPALVRIRWTHAAPAFSTPVTLLETLTGAVLVADLAYGDTVELDYAPDEMAVGADTDADGLADLVFESFQRTGGEYFHTVLTNEEDGTPFLLGQGTAAVPARRDVLP